MDTWYYSPYPLNYEKIPIIYICEKCLKYMALQKSYFTHKDTCSLAVPPGRQIYHDKNLCVFEIDGALNKLYCQNLCLLAKFFLDHKTLYFDVSPFHFYVAYEYDGFNYHITSYFSKEKVSVDNYNVACILTFPPYQRKGYGKFLISLSYEISKAEKTIGTPEKPLSDLGHLSYKSYWSYIILNHLRTNAESVITLNDLSFATGIDRNDIGETLQSLNLLKYWKGNYVACYSSKIINDHLNSGHCRPPKLVADPQYLTL
ncbi:hypothetical protein HZS_7325 [Henneguya salminicola]|nr:hypothetical protein HZS_7325 [Henneguya salminicola]